MDNKDAMSHAEWDADHVPRNQATCTWVERVKVWVSFVSQRGEDVSGIDQGEVEKVEVFEHVASNN